LILKGIKQEIILFNDLQPEEVKNITMISIIISTHKPELFEAVKVSIEETIGVAYEIIGVENHARYSICEAYNIGERQAKYPYLCFVHEDVLFKTKDWGKSLISIMEADKSIGLIGIAGTKFRSSYPSSIGQGPGLRRFLRGNIYHWDKYKDFDVSILKSDIDNVVCIDGVFMFSKKDVFQHCRFDEQLLTHFHGYDIDFSLQIFFQGYRVIVDRKILLSHYSNGNYAEQNTKANRLIGKKWKRKLPVVSKDLKLSWMDIHILDSLNWLYFLKTAFISKCKQIFKF